MAIFSSRERAEQFIARDPFVLEGIAHPGDIREWDALNYHPSPYPENANGAHPGG
ncbi:hypothetical protein [Rhodococcus sp. A14]|uniref:hypothetical protein n=1 Tax=Rhodococcus sp. A14 TaxID=1194106 RepID=UPI001F0F0955